MGRDSTANLLVASSILHIVKFCYLVHVIRYLLLFKKQPQNDNVLHNVLDPTVIMVSPFGLSPPPVLVLC